MSPSKQPGLRRFIFTSTYATVGRRHGHVATEDDVIASRGLTPYVQSRVQAENLVMRYVAEAGLPAVAMCVSTTYGDGDWGGTPHGAFIAGAVFGKLPFLMDGIQLEVVGVDDAARAMILAAEHGRIGERYLVSERMIALNEVVRIAADEAGVPPPQRAISVPTLYAHGRGGQPESAAHRQGRRTQPHVGADDAQPKPTSTTARRCGSWAGSRARSRNRSARPPGSGTRCARLERTSRPRNRIGDPDGREVLSAGRCCTCICV